MSEKRSFTKEPAPKIGLIECRIYREAVGVQKMFPKYILRLEQGQTLLFARKQKKHTSSSYLISLDAEDLSKSSSSFCGKLSSNFVGTEFSIFDGGKKPSSSSQSTNFRKHLGCIVYENNFLGTKGPRKMQVAIPEVNEDGKAFVWQPHQDVLEEGLLEQYKLGNHTHQMVLFNKKPQWNDDLRAFVLNFKGRVTKASVKNFQLINHFDPDNILLQFGKIGKNDFSLDFQYPMSALQAFSIALSSFDNKLMCE